MKRLALVMALGALLAACGGGKSNPPPSGGGSGTVSGFVTDIGSGAKLAGVAVQAVGVNQTATTDETGAFALGSLPSGKVKLSFSKTGYAPGYATAVSGTDTASTLVTLKKEGAAQPYNPSTARTLYQTTEAGPYAVIFQPGSFNTSDPNLKVSITPLDPTKESQALPGQLITGSTPLLPVTFAEFSITDSAGKRVNLKPGASAIVELPIPPDLRSTYKLGDKIHCYSYNPETGQWEDFVEGTVEVSSVDGSTPVLKASIRHFSWYGGAPEGQKCRNGAVQVVDANGKPLQGATVVVTPGVNGTTNADGVATVWIAEGNPNPKMYAYKESTNADGRISNLPKTAKIIDIGYFVIDDLGVVLPGLNQADCASISPSSLPKTGPSAQANLGTPGNPFVIKLAPVGQAVYRVTAIMMADGTAASAAGLRRAASGGSVFVTLEQGIPNPDGDLDAPTPVDGAKITLSDPNGGSAELTSVGQGSGSYYLQGGLPLTPGTRYTLKVDADGNGSIDGSGTAYAVGNVAWDPALNGSSRPSAGFTAQWSDSASATPSYAAVYYAFLSNGAADVNNFDFDYYIGPALQFTPHSNAQGAATNPNTPLKPGTYQGSLWAFSGAYSPSGNNNFSVSDNITGLGLSGQFYSFSAVPSPISFTLTP
ncbi:MAG: hypothetical protein C4342_06260 [Armatimonadota bacterium]